jgi:chitinase
LTIALTLDRPKKCDVGTDGAVNLAVRIGYYDASAASRDCNAVQPENLAAGVLTHINVAYEYINEKGEITDQNGQTMARMARLKRRYNGLRVNVVLGGWEFNDPYSDDSETMHRWSNMVSTVPNREWFIASLVTYMHTYSLNGVDIGEYLLLSFPLRVPSHTLKLTLADIKTGSILPM